MAKSKSWMIPLFAVIIVLVLLGGFGLVYLKVGTTQNSFNPNSNQATGGSSGGTTIVTSNPVISIVGQDAQSQGTAVGVNAPQYSSNGGGYTAVTLGTTTAAPGDSIALLLPNGTTYHNAYLPAIDVGVSTFPVTVQFNKNATVTENIFNTLGVATSNDGSVANQTALGNGQTYNWKDAMSGTALQSTQDMTCVIELTAGINASSTSGVTLGLNGANIPVKSTSTPSWYSVVSTNSRVWLFDIGALNSGAETDYSIGLTSASTKSFPAGSYMKKSCYTKEWHIDPNSGLPVYNVVDSNDNVKSMGVYTRTVYFS